MTSVSNPNQHIEEYINYYMNNKHAEFAVLINGGWGTGKTWFIKKIINEKNIKNAPKKMAYISLNGISKISEISSEIFKFLHPVLGSDSAKLAGRILSSTLKTAFKIDINGDGKDDGTVSLSSPNLKIPDYLKINNDFILVFDDLERCNLKIEEIFGYINYFVEQEKIKVIVIGNEEEILKNESKESANYKKIKEKIFGTTFEYISDFETAIDFFITEIFNGELLDRMLKSKYLIVNKFNLINYKNLRSLKQVLSDFNRIYNRQSWGDDEDLFNKILEHYLIYSLENKAGVFGNSTISFLDENIEKEFYRKYSKYFRYDNVFSTDMWDGIILKNQINMDEIAKSIKANHYDLYQENPDWLKLWYHENLNDDEFFNLIDDAKNKLILKKYEKYGEIKHIVALLNYFNNHKVIEVDISTIIAFALDNISSMKSVETYEDFSKRDFFEENESWSGKGYYECENQIFKDFLVRARNIEFELNNEIIKSESKKLIDLLETDSLKFAQKISGESGQDYYYSKFPILKYIEVSDFYNNFMKLDSVQKRRVLYALNQRYMNTYSISDEEKWLKDLISYFQEQHDQKTDGIEKFNLNHRCIRLLISNLEKFKK